MQKARRNLEEIALPLAQPIVVGLSGGADSVALAVLLSEEGYQLELVHINFQLRERGNNRDQRFVEELVATQFPTHSLHIYTEDTQAYAQRYHLSP